MMRLHSLKILLEQEGILVMYFCGKTIWLKFDNYGVTDGTVRLNFKNNNNSITLINQPTWILRFDSLSPSQQNQLYSEKDWLTYEVN